MLINKSLLRVNREDEMNLALKSNPSLEQALVAKATSGDLEAFNQLVSNYQDEIGRAHV